MGYFSQRKKHQRENIFLKVMLITLGLLVVASFSLADDSDILGYINAYRFQIYAITLLVFFYSLFLQRYLYGTFFALFLIINYTIITSSANLFSNQSIAAAHRLSINYQRHHPLSVEASALLNLRNGRININNEHQAQFLTFEKNLHVFTVVAVDFSHYDYQTTKASFDNLQKFIAQQDDPVIVIGNFGEPAWSPIFAKFLNATGLEVKNRLILGDKHRVFNPVSIPQFYILGFANLGVEDLDIKYSSDDNPKIKAQLSFY